MRRAAVAAAILSGALTVLPYPAAAGASALWGRDVTLITPNADEIVELERMTWEKGEPVTKIYGNPIGSPMRVLFPKPERIIIPREDPSVTLLKVDKQAGDNPLQVQTLWYFAKWMMIAGSITLVLSVAAMFILHRRSNLSGTPRN